MFQLLQTSVRSQQARSSQHLYLQFVGVILFAGVICPFLTMAGTVSPTLLKEFQTKPKITVMVNMAEGTSATLESLSGKEFPDQDARANAVTAALQALAERSQKAVKEFCKKEGITFQSFWISNSLVAENVTLDQAKKLAEVEGVKEVREQAVVHTMGSMGTKG